MRVLPYRMTRYVWGEVLGPFFLGLLLYTFVVMMNHLFIVAERALSKNLGWDLTVRLFVVGIPQLLVMTIPMAVLLGVMIAVGRLSADHEWVALQAAGQGPMRLLRPIAMFGLAGTLVTLMIYGLVVPRANYAMRSLRGQVLFASNLAADLKPRVFYSTLPNLVLYVSDIQQGERERLRGVLLVSQVDEGVTELFLARAGDLYPAPDSPGQLVLDLYDGVDHIFNPYQPETYRYASFDSRQLRMDAAVYLKSFLDPPDKAVPDLTPRELVAELREATAERGRVAAEVEARGGEDTGSRLLLANHRLRVATIEINQRLALSMASFFLSLLALPLGATRVRSGKGAGFALSLVVILVYWVAFTLGRNQASQGALPAALGPWIGNLVIFPWAVYALWCLQRRTGREPLTSRFARSMRRILSRFSRRPARTPTDDVQGKPARLADMSGTTARFVGRIDHYISTQFLRVLTVTLLSAYLVYGLVEFKNLVEDALRRDQPLELAALGKYFFYFFPGILWVVLPISCLVGGVVTFTLFGRTGELTAIKAGGLSIRRATVPVLLLTGVLCGILFIVQDRITPGFNRKALEVKDLIVGNPPRSYAAPAGGQWSFGPEGRRLFHYRHYDVESEEYRRLTILDLDREAPRVLAHRFARTARLLPDGWELGEGWYRTLPIDGSPAEFTTHKNKVRIGGSQPADLRERDRRLASIGDLPEQLSLEELTKEIESLEASGYDVTRLRVDYHGKWARACSPLVMVLLGLPFAFKMGRKGSLYGVGVALLLILVYWATFAIFNALGLQAILDPRIAAWGPNILFGLLGSYLMLYIKT